jgi:hypothetical protein
VWTRWLAAAATAWTGAYLVLYLALVHHDGAWPAWWYVGLLAIGTVPLLATVTGQRSRPALAAGAAVLALAALLGLLSIGLLLLPAVACAIVAAAGTGSPSRTAAKLR